MSYDPDQHHPRSIRLREYDYSQAGAYFVTICLQNRESRFGDVVCGAMQLNTAGHMIEKWWAELPHKFVSVETDEYLAMPNHFHGIVVIAGHPSQGDLQSGHPHREVATDGEAGKETRRATLGDIVDWFKTMTTNEYIRGVKECGWPRFAGKLWQRNYYEHIVRNEQDLSLIREYIRDNPARWLADENNPRRIEAAPS